MRRNRTVPRGQVHRLSHVSKALEGNLHGDPTGASCMSIRRPGAGRRGAAAAGGPRRLHRLGHEPHQLEEFRRERAGAARPADRRGRDGPGRGRLPRLLHPARRQPVHQQRRAGALRGLSAPGGGAAGRAPLLLRRRRASAASSASPPAGTAPSSMPCAMAGSGARPPATPATWLSSSVYGCDIPATLNELAKHGRSIGIPRPFREGAEADRPRGPHADVPRHGGDLRSRSRPASSASGCPAIRRTAELIPERWANWLAHDPVSWRSDRATA